MTDAKDTSGLQRALNESIGQEALKLSAAGVSKPRVQQKAENTVFGRFLARLGALVVVLMAALVAIPLFRGDGVPAGLVVVLLLIALFGMMVFGVGAHMVSRESGGFFAVLAGLVNQGIANWRGK